MLERLLWLWSLRILGFEQESQEGDEGSSGDDDDSDDSGTESGSPEDDDDDDSSGDDDFKSEESKRRVLADLHKERKERQKLQKELKKFEKERERQEEAEKTELQKAQDESKKAAEKVQRLAVGLLNQSLETAISRAAQKAKFKDADDALRLVDRDDIEYEQDEDDPSKITVDVKSVEKAVETLAKAKPHLVNESDEGGKPTGSKFGGKKKTKVEADEDALRQKYPALRR